MKTFLHFFLLTFTLNIFGQEKPYFYQIPEAPTHYTPENVAARLVDGLGFRYYWATEGLRDVDLNYQPTKEARTSLQTLEHILDLTAFVNNAVQQRTTTSMVKPGQMTFEEIRAQTLENLKEASLTLRTSGADLNNFKMKVKLSKSASEYPFWDLINGPISDALWHVGQVVSLRRASGNPFPEGVSLLQGKKIK